MQAISCERRRLVFVCVFTFPQNNGTMPPGPNPGNDNNNDPKPEEDNEDSPIDENEFAIYKAKGFYLNIGNLYLIILSMILLEL